MSLIRKYQAFYEAFLNKDKEKAIDLIVSSLSDKTGIDLYPYDELFHIQKDNLFLTGQLFLSLRTNKAVRINWIKDDIRSEINSMDVWDSFSFDSDPDYTIETGNRSVVKVLPDIVSFFKNPEIYISEIKNSVLELYDPSKELEEQEAKLRRARSLESKEKIGTRIERLKASIAHSERVERDSDYITQSDLNIDVFKSIELYTIQVAKGRSNSLIITGMSGVGKTSTVIDALRSIGMIADVHYYKSSGTITTAALYEILFKHRNKLLIFDDCDTVVKEQDSVDLLKAALDTYDVRELSKHTTRNTFDSITMSDKEIQDKWEESGGGLLPNRFEFRGRVIFISNLPEEKFDDALISRSLHVDVNLSEQEVVARMRDIMSKILPDVPMFIKAESLEYLTYVIKNYPAKFDLNIRTLIHTINLRVGNEETMLLGGKEELVWKLLVKKYLVRTKRKEK